MNATLRITALACGAILASCAGVDRPGDSTPGAAHQPPVEVATSDGPDRLADIAVARNPLLVAARHRAERLAAMAPQAAAWPDPMLEVSGGSMAETAAGRVDGIVGVKQKVLFPGKQGAAEAAAKSEAAAARADVKALELRIREQVHAAWWDYHLAHRTLELTRESQSLLEAVRDAVDARVAADQAKQSDQIRVSNELAMVDRELAEAQQLMDTSRARLNRLLSRSTDAQLPDPSRVAPPTLDGQLAKWVEHAESGHPEIRAAERRIAAFRHRLKRAKLEKMPDITLGIATASVDSSGLSPVANGRDQVMATLGITLPWWQEPRRALVREAEEGIAETRALFDAKRDDLRYRVEEAWFRARTARDVSTIFSTRLIPDSLQAYEVTLTGYSTGQRSFNDLIETWRQQLAYRLQHARNQAQIGKAVATLKAAAGVQ